MRSNQLKSTRDKAHKVYIPNKVIKEVLEHPEAEGDMIVTLINGMWTDAFHDEKGRVYTITNNDELISYLKSLTQ